ncbi:MAG TPA: nucleotide sugar dehydrogenase [Xanthobacteraceae bacterium]|nr:nucleotide sugar dehydrogenase [Xanthobacteraceae bacterium]
MSERVIGFAGMTHLGLLSAAAAADRGFQVVAYDPAPAAAAALERGELAIVEPDLPALMARHREQVMFTAQVSALSRCEVVYVAADVPTDEHGRSDLDPIRAMVDRVARAQSPQSTLVILSQVPPGFTRALPVPSERLYYQVETLVFGRAVERATRPERFIIGCADPSRPLPAAWAGFLAAFSCPILPMRYESAELAKISINACLVASLSVANQLAELSESIGADWAEIVPALRLDQRIGAHAYLKPGLGIAGGNLERDLRTIITLAQGRHIGAGLVQAFLDHSAHRKDWTFTILAEGLLARNPSAKIAVLGLAYKENTQSTKNSPALALLERLRGCAVSVHDPVVSATVVPWAVGAADPMEAVTGADALVIATPWPHYGGLKPAALQRAMAGRLILDPYRVLDGRACAAAGFTYYALGVAPLTAST